MIRYALSCNKQHSFESWFKNSAAFDAQVKRGLVTCPVCGSADVEKAIMAPAISKQSRAASAERAQDPPAERAQESGEPSSAARSEKTPVAILSEKEQELRRKLKELRDHLIENSDYVGTKFPEEARKMHYGEIEHRSIYGEATAEDAAALTEEGIGFHPLPYLPDEQN